MNFQSYTIENIDESAGTITVKFVFDDDASQHVKTETFDYNAKKRFTIIDEETGEKTIVEELALDMQDKSMLDSQLNEYAAAYALGKEEERQMTQNVSSDVLKMIKK